MMTKSELGLLLELQYLINSLKTILGIFEQTNINFILTTQYQ